MIFRTVLRWCLLAVAIWITTLIVPGIQVTGGPWEFLFVAALFAVINLVMGSLTRVLTFPLLLVTLGLFSLVINALMLMLTDYLSDALRVDNFFAAFLGGLCVTVASALLQLFFRDLLRRED
jgi:putative membrane protein